METGEIRSIERADSWRDLLAAMATQRILIARVWTPDFVSLDIRCISPQLVFLLQTSGEHENDVTLFSGEQPALLFQTQLAL